MSLDDPRRRLDGSGVMDDEELAFQRLYGPWQAVDPFGAQQMMRGYDAFWWVAGGYAIEAATGVARAHDDIDVVVFRKDLDILRDHFEGRYHLWSAGAGMLRPVDDRFPEPHAQSHQVWLREHALAPWRMDCPLNPDLDGRWQSPRDETHVASIDEVTWVHDDGVRYLNPEIVLLLKAKLDRPKDRADVATTWPLLDDGQRTWLRGALQRLYPGHPWLAVDPDAWTGS